MREDQEFIMRAGRRVLNVLYALCNKSSESSVLRTWLRQQAKHSVFLLTMKCRGGYCDFYIGFYSNTLHSLGVFARYHALVSLHSKPRPQLTIWITHSSSYWSMLEFLTHDFPKTSCTEHIVGSTLSSLPYYILLGGWKCICLSWWLSYFITKTILTYHSYYHIDHDKRPEQLHHPSQCHTHCHTSLRYRSQSLPRICWTTH